MADGLLHLPVHFPGHHRWIPTNPGPRGYRRTMPERTAIVVVHGMGQQRAGRLQRSLGKALSSPDDRMYVAPDRISGRTDTHRVTIVHPDGDETHVYEHYWADRFQDTRLRHVLPWIVRLLAGRSLGDRIGSRNAGLETAVGIITMLPHIWLVLIALFGNRESLAEALVDVPVFGTIAAIVLVAFTVTKLLVRSHIGAIIVGAVAGSLGAVATNPDLGGFSFALAALLLMWAPGWLLMAAGLRGVGPVPFLRVLVMVAVLVPLALAAVDPALVIGGLPAVLSLVILTHWIRHWMGDVARYLDRRAANAGEADRLGRDAAEFLWDVCTDVRYGYEDIVLVAHSQGGFVAYDALSRVWARWAEDHEIDFEERVAIDDVDRLATSDKRTGIEWGAAVDELFDALRQREMPWKIRHFVTLGSPIAHAAGLVGNGTPDLRLRAEERALATCPPTLHGDPGSVAYATPHGHRFHHTSVFAAVRWSNVVYANDLLGGPVDGDGLGGEVQNLVLGEGDLDFSATILDFALRFPHDAYWQSTRPAFDPHVARTLELLRHICRGD